MMMTVQIIFMMVEIQMNTRVLAKILFLRFNILLQFRRCHEVVLPIHSDDSVMIEELIYPLYTAQWKATPTLKRLEISL